MFHDKQNIHEATDACFSKYAKIYDYYRKFHNENDFQHAIVTTKKNFFWLHLFSGYFNLIQMRSHCLCHFIFYKKT